MADLKLNRKCSSEYIAERIHCNHGPATQFIQFIAQNVDDIIMITEYNHKIAFKWMDTSTQFLCDGVDGEWGGK